MSFPYSFTFESWAQLSLEHPTGHVLIAPYEVRAAPVTPSTDMFRATSPPGHVAPGEQDQSASVPCLNNICSHGFIFRSNRGDTKHIMTDAK